MKLPSPISFDWDHGNLEKNWDKHQVHYREVEEVFINKLKVIYKDTKHSQKEDRFTILGVTNRGRKLYVVFTIRKGKVRVISARDQSSRERNIYVKKQN